MNMTLAGAGRGQELAEERPGSYDGVMSQKLRESLCGENMLSNAAKEARQ